MRLPALRTANSLAEIEKRSSHWRTIGAILADDAEQLAFLVFASFCFSPKNERGKVLCSHRRTPPATRQYDTHPNRDVVVVLQRQLEARETRVCQG